MRILLLGPECPRIEDHLLSLGNQVLRTEEPFDVAFLESHSIDFGVSYRYKRIIKQSVVDWLSGRLINLHISLLPWNRGADPNLWSFLEDTPSGVTIHKIDVGIDTGDILLQKAVEHNLSHDTLASSYLRLSIEIENLFLRHCRALLAGHIKPQPQQGAGSTHRRMDKDPYLYLIREKGWDTLVSVLLGQAVPKEKK